MKEWTLEATFIKPCQCEHAIAKNTMDTKISAFYPKLTVR